MIAKRIDEPYRAGERSAVVKVKPEKTADCVVVGVRWRSDDSRRIATLLLGLYRDDGASSTTSARPRSRRPGTTRSRNSSSRSSTDAPERRFSEPNRWGGGELEEVAVRPELVVEVRYDKVQGHRFRHGTKLLRLRPDKNPTQCTWRELRPPLEPGDPALARLLRL